MQTIPPKLIEQIQSGNCVAFVGSGFSAAAGLPRWRSLVDAVAEGLTADERDGLMPILANRVNDPTSRELEMGLQLLFDVMGVVRAQIIHRSARPTLIIIF